VAWKNIFASFDAALRLLHPFMPFLTEELWHQLPQRAGAKSIALDRFPEVHANWKNDTALQEFGMVQEVITAVRTMRAELKLDQKKRVAAELSSTNGAMRDLMVANKASIVRLGILSDLKLSSEHLQQTGGAVRSTSQFDVRIVYTETVDVAAEKARLQKESEGLQKAVASKEKQLGNETFRSRAPENIIKGLEATLAEQRIELRKLQDRLSQLEGAS
jgi:valyl-tRNA synthetase